MPNATPAATKRPQAARDSRKRKRAPEAPAATTTAAPPEPKAKATTTTTCSGVDFDALSGLPRACDAPCARGSTLCAAHADRAEQQRVWKSILRPDWRARLNAPSAPEPISRPQRPVHVVVNAPRPASPLSALAAFRAGSRD